jgi:DNA-binding XRE family transcriptional regulator
MNDIEQQVAEIKARLILARKRAGLSQEQAGKLVGFNRASSLAQHEGERSTPTLTLFLKLCEIYGISPVWALTGVNPDFDATAI